MNCTTRSLATAIATALLLLGACSSDTDPASNEPQPTSESGSDVQTAAETGELGALDDAQRDEDTSGVADTETSYRIDVWADNWMAVYIDGQLIGEDSVPITTERSFNAESFTFSATPPFTVAIEAKDFKETDSGIEYIGLPNQQIGDGGIIAQITDLTTGDVIAATDATWSTLVVHQAPLNPDCERDPDPDATCGFLILETPADWTAPDFDDSDWTAATEWTAADVDPKDGYNDISWVPIARLIWGTDLEIDNTVLLRTTIN